MNKKVPIPLYFAMLWILIKALLFTFNVPSQEILGVYVNLFFILIVIFASLHLKVKSEKKIERYASNFKTSLKNAGKYIIVVTVFIFAYYKFINPGHLKGAELNRVELELAKDFEKIKTKNPLYKDKTREEWEKQVRSSAQLFSSVTLNTSIYFLGMFFISLVYSIIIPIFYRKVVLRV
jgi:hypothetical protein